MNQKSILKITSIIITLTFIISSLTGCINEVENDNGNSPIRESLVIGMGGNIFGFFPWLDSYDVATMMINLNIFNALVEFDQILRIKPKLATSWNNPNNLTWRFYLRENVKFHNGYNFTAEDVKFSIDLIKSC